MKPQKLDRYNVELADGLQDCYIKCIAIAPDDDYAELKTKKYSVHTRN